MAVSTCAEVCVGLGLGEGPGVSVAESICRVSVLFWSWSHILSGAVRADLQRLVEDGADGRYATAGAISAVDTRVTAPADISCTSLTASSAVNSLNFTGTRVNTTGATPSQDVQTPLLRPISAVDDHLRIAAGLVSTRMVDNDGATRWPNSAGRKST